MTTEEKAKAYDEAYKKVAVRFGSNVADEIFLKESEDERIRKALVRFHKSTIDIDGVKGENILSWLEKQGEHAKFCDSIQVGDKVTRNEDGVLVNLSQLKRVAKKDEKQGEQKSAEWSNKDSLMLNCTISALQSEADRKDGYIDKDTLKDLEKWLKSIKDRVQPQPKQEWSEEDETVLGNLIWALENDRVLANDRDEYVYWLKSLRPQNHWKPSEEQMKTLNEVINYCANGKEAYLNDYIYNRLIDLRDELNKL